MLPGRHVPTQDHRDDPRICLSREGMARLAALPKAPDHIEQWNAEAERMRTVLRDQILGGFPRRNPLEVAEDRQARKHGRLDHRPSADIRSQGLARGGKGQQQGTALAGLGWTEERARIRTRANVAELDEIKTRRGAMPVSRRSR